MKRDSFVFYRSFKNAISSLPKDKQLKTLLMVVDYALDGQEPPPNCGYERAIFELVRPQIDTNNKRYENGCKGAEYGKKGGRPKKEKPPQKPQNNPEITPNVNNNVDVYVDVDDNGGTETSESDCTDTALKEFLARYPSVQVDTYGTGQLSLIDFAELLKRFDESEYLRNNCNSLKWLVKNRSSVMSGKYKDREQPQHKPVVDGSLYKIV